MSTFSGLNIGLSSLYAQRRGLELTGHNVANANTEGYSRQRVRLQADGGPVTPALHAEYDGVGNGVTVADTQRLRDTFLEARSVLERGTDGMLRGQQTALSRLEGIFGEPSDAGLQSQLADFWQGWDDVANDATDPAARSQLLQRAGTLVTGLNGAAERLEAQWSGSHEQLLATVKEINSVAADVAGFNRAIVSATHAGQNTSDLTDQRDLLVQRLAQTAGVSVTTRDHGSVDVVLGGRALVSGRTAATLVVGGAASLTLPAGAANVTWSDGAPAPVGGSTGGLLSELNTIVPAYRTGLQEVADALRTSVNAQHRQGFDQAGAAGVDLFTRDATSGRLAVAFTDTALVAAGAVSSTGGDRNGANAAVLAELAAAPGGPDRLYRKLVVQLGVDAQSANRRVDIQVSILGQVDAAREAEAGVNLDEEMTNMLAYQRAYEGAARFLSSIDQMLDTLINRTGRVGL